eukprot:SAG31_NODE_28711_length_406_cov_0.706840_1_plen_90_part_01
MAPRTLPRPRAAPCPPPAIGFWAAAAVLAMVLHPPPANTGSFYLSQWPFHSESDRLSVAIDEMLLNATETLQGAGFSNITAPDSCVTFPP